VGSDLSPRTLLTEPGNGNTSVEQPAGASDTADRPWNESDLRALFDTAVDPPNLDVGNWICEPADRTALAAWRTWEAGEPSEEEIDPGRDELCPVPLDELRRVLDGRAWLRDRRDGLWRRATAEDLAPGVQILLDARHGGYLPDQGWSPDSTVPVATSVPVPQPSAFACVAWISLDQHLAETEDEARQLIDALPGLLSAAQQEAVVLAARYHDLGKCHEVFQEMLRSGGGDPPDVLLAKSKAPYSTGRSRRPYFRHELVSALILMEGDHWHGEHTDHRLVTYLAAAHHGKVRISVRPQADEETALLGVVDGDRTPAIALSSGETFPGQSLRTADFRPGDGGTWTEQAQGLRDRADLGPFRLAYLETLVRIADWRSSARHDGPVEPATVDAAIL
jgi:CRISPR-associated endonuclease/helicase Cas3